MTVLYVKVPGTRGMATVARVIAARTRYKGKLPVYQTRAGQRVVPYAKRIANMAAFIEGHGYAEVWDKHRRLYAVGNADR